MFKFPFAHVAKIYMNFRECLVPDRRREAQEEVVADLHSCLEQLMHRSTEMETKIDLYMKRALYHMQISKREQTPNGKSRERTRARMYLEDKRRIQMEYDKAQRSIHMLQQQIDSIVSSQVDMAIVDAMRQFNANAARLSLPSRAAEIEHLAEELAERQSEVSNFQEAISGVSSAMEDVNIKEESDDLWNELEAYMSSPTEKVNQNRDIISQHSMNSSNLKPKNLIVNQTNKEDIISDKNIDEVNIDEVNIDEIINSLTCPNNRLIALSKRKSENEKLISLSKEEKTEFEDSNIREGEEQIPLLLSKISAYYDVLEETLQSIDRWREDDSINKDDVLDSIRERVIMLMTHVITTPLIGTAYAYPGDIKSLDTWLTATTTTTATPSCSAATDTINTIINPS